MTINDGRESSSFGPQDELFACILKEAAAGAEPAEVARKYASVHPELAGPIGDFLRTVGELGRASGDGPAVRPDRIGDFRIRRWMGRGGMGDIYEAVQEPLDRRAVVKTIRSDRGEPSRQVGERFETEQLVLAKLHHTHIVPVFAAGLADGLRYFAMPYLEGLTLAAAIERLRGTAGSGVEGDTPTLSEVVGSPWVEPPADLRRQGSEEAPNGREAPGRAERFRPSIPYLRSVATAMADAAEALQGAHEVGVIHRDVKPSNLMVGPDEHCWVIDFGLASYRRSTEDQASASGDTHAMGTPGYMAPEQYEGRADARADVWGLGLTLLELITLRRAFAGNDPIALRAASRNGPVLARLTTPTLPRDLEAICARATQPIPEARYPTAADLAADLRRWLLGEPVTARPAMAPRRLALWAHRNPGWAVAVASAAALIVALGAGGMALGQAALARERAERRESLLLRVKDLRTAQRRDGWSARASQLMAEAVSLRPDDPAVRDEAVSMLAGLDAHAAERFENFGAAAVRFDARGDRLLIGEVTDRKDPGKLLRARLWDARTDRMTELSVAARGPVAFLPDGSPVQLVRDPGGGSLTLTNLSDGKPLRRLEAPGASLGEDPHGVALGLSPDGSLAAATVVAAGGEPSLAVWDASTGVLLHRFDGDYACAAFSADRALVAAGTVAGAVSVRSMRTGAEVARLDDRSGLRPHALAFADDPRQPRNEELAAADDGRGYLLAVGGAGGSLAIWDVAARVPRAICRGSHWDVFAIAFSPDGTLLASSGRDMARLWDAATGEPLLDVTFGNYLRGVAFAPDGRRLAVAGEAAFDSRGQVRLVDLEDGRGLRRLRGLTGVVERVAFSADGRVVAGLSHGWLAAAWRISTGELVHTFDAPHGVFADNAGVALSPDGVRLVISAGHEARAWDVATGRRLDQWTLPEALGDTPFFAPDGRLLLVRVETKDGRTPPFGGVPWAEHPRVIRVRRLDPEGRAPVLAEIADFPRYVFAVRVTPDVRHLIAEGLYGPSEKDRALRLFDMASGALVRSLEPPLGGPSGVFQFDPTGKVLAHFTSETGTTFLEIPTGALLGRVAEDVMDLSPGAERLLTFEAFPHSRWNESVVRERGRDGVLTRIPWDALSLNFSRFSPDGRYLAGGGPDGTIGLADLPEISRRLARMGLGR